MVVVRGSECRAAIWTSRSGTPASSAAMSGIGSRFVLRCCCRCHLFGHVPRDHDGALYSCARCLWHCDGLLLRDPRLRPEMNPCRVDVAFASPWNEAPRRSQPPPPAALRPPRPLPRPSSRVARFPPLVSRVALPVRCGRRAAVPVSGCGRGPSLPVGKSGSAPGRTRTCATGSGGRCSIR
jgi:hypothetical protein